MVKENWGIRIR